MVDFSKIRDLGTARSVLEGKSNSPLSELLGDRLSSIVDALKKRIDYYDADASRSLKASISPTRVSIIGGTVNISVEANYYWKFINYGVNGIKMNWGAPTWGQQKTGGKTFSDLIYEWMRYRSIKPDSRGGVKLSPSSYKSLNFLIRRSIREKGQEPRPFVDDVMTNQVQSDMTEEISEMVGRSVEVILQIKME